MEEERFYTGAVPHPGDDRNHIYDDAVMGAAPVEIDWETGFDIRNVLGGEIITKDQKNSLSCVGQAWSYQVWVYQVLEAMRVHSMNLSELRVHFPELVEHVSAKAIYSQIYLGGGGAYIMAGAKLIAKWGSLFEPQVPSTDTDGSVTEVFMRDESWKTPAMELLAEVLKGKDYKIIRAKDNMDLFAQAIIENHGVVGGLTGQNGRGWRTERPQPPIPGQKTWGHCVNYLAFGTDEYGRFIATPNSWNDFFASEPWEPGKPPGYGWQKLYQDYFTREWQFDPWTYTDLPNTEYNDDTMLSLIKGDRPEIYVVGKNGKKHHVSGGMDVLQMGAEAGLWEQYDPAKHDKLQSELDAMPTGNPIAFIL